MSWTLLWDSAVAVIDGDYGSIGSNQFADVTGWELRPEGLCNGDACVPVRDRTVIEMSDGRLLVEPFAAMFDRPIVKDPEVSILAVGASRNDRRDALANRTAPDFRLPALDGQTYSLSELRGRRTVLVTFSSWCGCRYDLPGWQALADELADEGLVIIAIAFDQEAEIVRPFAEGISIPVLYDPSHVVSELYAISNVPTTVWIDENGRIARPNTPAFGTDTFTDFHGVPSGPHLEMITSWVRGDDEFVPRFEDAVIDELSEDEVRARLLFRIGAHLHREGRDGEAGPRFDQASKLAPLDFTVARASMPLTGRDPFGEEFLALYSEWEQAGKPFHGLPPDMNF